MVSSCPQGLAALHVFENWTITQLPAQAMNIHKADLSRYSAMISRPQKSVLSLHDIRSQRVEISGTVALLTCL